MKLVLLNDFHCAEFIPFEALFHKLCSKRGCEESSKTKERGRGVRTRRRAFHRKEPKPANADLV